MSFLFTQATTEHLCYTTTLKASFLSQLLCRSATKTRLQAAEVTKKGSFAHQRHILHMTCCISCPSDSSRKADVLDGFLLGTEAALTMTVTVRFPFLNTSPSCSASRSQPAEQNEAQLGIFPSFQVNFLIFNLVFNLSFLQPGEFSGL